MTKKTLTFLLVISLSVGGYLYYEYDKITNVNNDALSSRKKYQESINKYLKKQEAADRKIINSIGKTGTPKVDGLYCFVSNEDDVSNSVILVSDGLLFFRDRLETLKGLKYQDIVNYENGGLLQTLDNKTLVGTIVRTSDEDGAGSFLMKVKSQDSKGNVNEFYPKDFPKELYSKKICPKITTPKSIASNPFVGNYCSTGKVFELVEFRSDKFIVRGGAKGSVGEALLRPPRNLGRVKSINGKTATFENLIIASGVEEEPQIFQTTIVKVDSKGVVQSFVPTEYPDETFSLSNCPK